MHDFELAEDLILRYVSKFKIRPITWIRWHASNSISITWIKKARISSCSKNYLGENHYHLVHLPNVIGRPVLYVQLYIHTSTLNWLETINAVHSDMNFCGVGDTKRPRGQAPRTLGLEPRLFLTAIFLTFDLWPLTTF